ncbi:MAG: serine/threonine-protein kinase, partial [Verrucomicrobiota bacterium]
MRDAEEAPDPGRPDAAARVGAVVDRYTLTRLIGRGGMGAVYEARHAALSRRFAIKFLLPELAARPDMLRRFENEAKAAGGLEHPNVAAVMDFGRANDGAPYIVMEFLQGEDCARLLKRSGPLPVARAANIVVQACRGLDVAHANGIVHRDLKPENLFVSDAGDGTDLVKVLDFGIAKLRVADAGVATGTGATFGTAFYMSPEQARGAADVDPRTDVWSLGVVLYELLAGQRPFAGDQFLQVGHQILSVAPRPLGDLRPALPARLIAAIDRAMAKELSARWPTVLAFADALSAFAGGRAVTDPGPSRS